MVDSTISLEKEYTVVCEIVSFYLPDPRYQAQTLLANSLKYFGKTEKKIPPF
jgi:hypothetical protein